jgi:hypothetical protein
MEIKVAPLAKHRLAVIADMLYNINIDYGRGCIRAVEIHSMASGRVSGTVTREIPTSRTTQNIEYDKFTVRAGVLRFIGKQRKV